MAVMEAFKRSLLDYSKKINDCTNALLTQEAVRHGLTAIQLRLLMELYDDGAMTIGEIAAQLGQAGTNVSTMCKKLEGHGLVSRQRSAADERIVMVVLTAPGKEKMIEINKMFDQKINRMMEAVEEDELRELLAGLKKFSDLLSLNSDLNTPWQKTTAANEKTTTNAKELD